jgi:hypothetical protein
MVTATTGFSGLWRGVPPAGPPAASAFFGALVSRAVLSYAQIVAGPPLSTRLYVTLPARETKHALVALANTGAPPATSGR